MKSKRRNFGGLLSLLVIPFISLILSACSGAVQAPAELPSQYWFGKFQRSNDSVLLSLDIQQQEKDLKGHYRFFGQHRQFEGEFTGTIGSDSATLTLEVPKEKARGMSETVVVNLSLFADCSPEEARLVRRHIKKQKGASKEMLEKKLIKMSGTATYEFNGTKEQLIGFVGESVKRVKK